MNILELEAKNLSYLRANMSHLSKRRVKRARRIIIALTHMVAADMLYMNQARLISIKLRSDINQENKENKKRIKAEKCLHKMKI